MLKASIARFLSDTVAVQRNGIATDHLTPASPQ